MNASRLTTLADFLSANAKALKEADAFRLELFANKTPRRASPTPGGPCGFVACACGWAATIPAFRRAGFRLTKGSGWSIILVSRSGDDNYDWEAIREFFDLDVYQAEYLFTTRKYPPGQWHSPTAVARRIRKFVASGGQIGATPEVATNNEEHYS